MRLVLIALIVLVLIVLFAGCWDRDRTLRNAVDGAARPARRQPTGGDP